MHYHNISHITRFGAECSSSGAPQDSIEQALLDTVFGARGVDAHQRDVIAEPFSANAFDYVVLSEVLEHLPLPEELLAALRPSAPRFLVSLPNTAYIFYRVGLALLGRFPTQWV